MEHILSSYLSLVLTMRRRNGGLEDFLEEQTGVDRNAVLALLPDGRQLTSDSIRELGSVPDEACH